MCGMWRRMARTTGLALAASASTVTATSGQVVSPAGQATEITLGEAVATALARNPEIATARYSLMEARERVSEAWSNVFPSVDLSTSYTRNLTPALNFVPAVFIDPNANPDAFVPVQFGADNIWNLSISAEQPLFNAAAFIGVGAAGRFEALQEEAFRGQAQAVVTRVRTAYYRLLLNQEQVRLLENSIRRVTLSLTDTRALADAGLVSDYDVLRLEVELANLEPNLRRAENAVLQDRRALAVELGMDEVGEDLRVAGSLATMRLDDPSANSADNREILAFGGPAAASTDALLQRAMGTRSDLLQLQLTESLRTTELRLEQIEYLPKVTVFGSYGINSQQNGSPAFFDAPRAYNRLAGLRVTLPIFQGLKRDARIDQKQALVDQARRQTDYARALARNEIQALTEQAAEARERADAQALAVAQATRGFEIASAQYREGIGSQLELTDAEVALRQSEFNYAQAVYDYLTARARLDEATGDVPHETSSTTGGDR